MKNSFGVAIFLAIALPSAIGLSDYYNEITLVARGLSSLDAGTIETAARTCHVEANIQVYSERDYSRGRNYDSPTRREYTVKYRGAAEALSCFAEWARNVQIERLR